MAQRRRFIITFIDESKPQNIVAESMNKAKAKACHQLMREDLTLTFKQARRHIKSCKLAP